MVCGGRSQFFWAPMYGGMTWDVPPGSMISRNGVRFKDLVVADAVGGVGGVVGRWLPGFLCYTVFYSLFSFTGSTLNISI